MRPSLRAALLFTAVLLTACRATAPTVSTVAAAPAAVAPAPAAPAAPVVTAIPDTPAAAATPLPASAPVAAAPATPAAPAVGTPLSMDYDRAELRGRLHLPPGRVLPDGVRMQLVLIDRFHEDPAHAVIARAEQPVSGPAPIAFTLGYDRGLVADPTRYVLDVALRDITGRMLYRSGADHPVNLSPDAEPTRVDLHAVGR